MRDDPKFNIIKHKNKKRILSSLILIIVLVLSSIGFVVESSYIAINQKNIYILNNPAENTYRPLVGGIRIDITYESGGEPPGKEPRSNNISPTNEYYYSTCTLGYPVKKINTNEKGYIAAAHCFPRLPISYVYQPTFEEYNNIGFKRFKSGTIDAVFVSVSVPLSARILHIWSPSGSYTLKPIRGTVPWNDSSYIGEIIYKTGYVTGTTSGHLIGFYRFAFLNGKLIEYAVKVGDMVGSNGDSGGPMYWIHPEFGKLYILGHIIGGRAGVAYGVHWIGPAQAFGVQPIISG